MKFASMLLLVALLGLLGGCATTSGEMRTFRIAGGKTIELPIARGGALPTENADVKIEVTGFMLEGANHALTYAFGFSEKKSERPESVKIEDVTGTESEVLVLDSAPVLGKEAYWKGTSTPRKKGDPSLAWLTEPGDTMKVFRFTIVTADGRELVMYQASVWGSASKPLVRKILGYGT
jgi:hypothetical protein